MITRKIASLSLALSVLVSGTAIAFADENTKDTKTDFTAAAQAMADAGMTGVSSAALVHDPALNAALLNASDGLSPTQLTAQALVMEQEQREAKENAARQQAGESAKAAARTALLAEYDGVMATTDLNVRAAPDGEVLRIIDSGKVVYLEDAVDGWYEISFDNTTGYISADYAQPVHYADYENTDATCWDEVTEDETTGYTGGYEPVRYAYSGNISTASGVREELVALAYTYLGTPYVYGGSSYSGTDCSGFTMAVFGAFGYGLSHGASTQYYQSMSISLSEAEAGDLIFFNTEGGISHVGLYLGGGSFIHASCSYGVTIDTLSGYYANCYVGVGRILP